jgi:hypothetical protein
MERTVVPRRSPPRWFRWLAGPLIALFTVVLMLGGGEAYFRFVHLQSDAYNQTLMAKRWLRECWKPLFKVENPAFPAGAFEFRDQTWTEADLVGKTRVMIVGDSFAAGHGLCRIEERFGEVLAARLGATHAVMNVAANGWGTQEETFYPVLYPFTPDVVVLSYFVNDIDNTIKTTPGTSLRIPPLAPAADYMREWPLRDSYLADYVYWQIIYKRQFEESGAAVTDTLLDAYADPLVWGAHRQELEQVIAWTEQIGASLIVVTWPRLEAIEPSQPALGKVRSVFEAHGIRVIEVTPLVAGLRLEERIVNPADTHPSALVHRLVGEALHDRLDKALATP